MKVAESITVEEIAIHDDSPAKPVGSPAPSKTAPQTPAAAKIEAEINAWEE
jgi:hypothetical protein